MQTKQIVSSINLTLSVSFIGSSWDLYVIKLDINTHLKNKMYDQKKCKSVEV